MEERIPEKHKHQHFLHSLINEKRLRQWFGRVDRKEDQDDEEEWESKRQLMRKLAVIRGDPKTGYVASWINVIPCEALGTKINSPTYLAMLRWWSGASAWQRGKCKMRSMTGKICGKHLDRFGDHAVMCPTGPGVIARHDALNKAWFLLESSVGFHCKKWLVTRK